MKRLIFPILTFVLVVWGMGCADIQRVDSKISISPDVLRPGALDDLFVLRDYRAGKNSFVESPERHIGAWMGTGRRYTLLDVEGCGSIRHIWSTRREGPPHFDFEFFVDGESQPSLRGTDVDLVRAMEEYPLPVAPSNWVPLGKRDFNFYLPIPFDKSIRVDVVQREPSFWLWFCQLDYRLEDESMKGVRLFSRGEGDDLQLSYVGMPTQRRNQPAPVLKQEEKSFDVTLQPNEMLRLVKFEGPGIVRELRMRRPDESNLRLMIRYEGCDSFAVNAPVDAFFGPFQGASFYAHGPNDSSCYLPMPYREQCEIIVVNEGNEASRVSGMARTDQAPGFSSSWGYLHALYQRTEKTNGHRLHQVLYTRGRGHWVGMSLYKTGHDHGGGDFAVIDGEGANPAFLHGVNGEDYFTFAWFGKGAHHPYAVAHTNDEGRYRHHLENVYPFNHSIAVEWGAFADLSPESVAVWYQDSPQDLTLPDGARDESVEWDVFGPVPIPFDESGRTEGDPFAVLPSVRELDAGKEFSCQLVEEAYASGWMKEWSTGPMLNLTYIGRHKTNIAGEVELGGMGHAFLARRFIESEKGGETPFLFAHDDPIEIWMNGERVFACGRHFNGFENQTIYLPLKKGRNEIVVRLTNYFNRNFNWTGFLLREK